MIKADLYFRSTLEQIMEEGVWSKEPRTKWTDGNPAHYKSIKQKSFRYNILDDEFPIITYRKTFLKGAFYDIDAIYIKQTNLIQEMHSCIHNWWMPFVVDEKQSIGQTYGHTVKRYDLMNKLLRGLEQNPDGRRHIINLWQEQQMMEDPKALVPCAFMTEWSVESGEICNYIDLTLTQRSMDFLMTASINPIQYVMLGMMVCNHLSFKTNKEHKLRFFEHHIQDVHIYDRHMESAQLLLASPQENFQPKIVLSTEKKDFYEHIWSDFKIINNVKSVLPLSLEIAI